ncbi:MAG TPA: DUF6274 family protein [Streptomyces sp.]|uniref:DUF6274 family protein n=1 Tax=Streptomyces sp. TaxID=1931 RepID=UPI002D4C2B7B|nr:DUF6274 family protein [Streptomyces sp.]HZG04022.1 DUF6274 family protein [Streptomyces sp.]
MPTTPKSPRHATRALLRAHLAAAARYGHATRHCPVCHRLQRLAMEPADDPADEPPGPRPEALAAAPAAAGPEPRPEAPMEPRTAAAPAEAAPGAEPGGGLPSTAGRPAD